MTYLDNPAGLLRYWIEEQFGEYRNKNEALVHATCDILGIKRSTIEGNMATLRLAVQLSELCRDVRRDVAELPEHLHPQLLLADFHQIEGAINYFAMSHQHQLSSMLGAINPAGSRGLEYLDTFLHSNLRHRSMQEEAREDLLSQVRELIHGIKEADDLDLATKDFLLSRLQEVEAALREALITGTVRIERATESLIGAMHRRPDLWERIAETKWGPRVKSMAVGLCMALSAVGGLPALMPGEASQPTAITQETNVEVNVVSHPSSHRTPIEGDFSAPVHDDDDVVDAEIVEDRASSSQR